MGKKIGAVAILIGAGAMLALPATGAAESKRCEKTPKVGYTVTGTLVSGVPDDPNTEAFEGSGTITVTDANGHALKSGNVVVGEDYTVSGDPYRLVLEGYEGEDEPSPGDLVQVVGKIERAKKKCVAEGTPEADRYGTPDIRQVVVTDSDPDV